MLLCRQDGRTLFRNAVLRKQGWEVLTIPWYEWTGLVTQDEKAHYLEIKLKQTIKEYRQTLNPAV